MIQCKCNNNNNNFKVLEKSIKKYKFLQCNNCGEEYIVVLNDNLELDRYISKERLEWLKTMWTNRKLEDLEGEVWKDIQSHNGDYKVSNLGRVKSFKSSQPLILKQFLNERGYAEVSMFNNLGKPKSVHRLVCMAFIENAQNKRTVDHIYAFKGDNNTGKTANAVECLRWFTDSEQAIDALEKGLRESDLTFRNNIEQITIMANSGEYTKNEIALHFKCDVRSLEKNMWRNSIEYNKPKHKARKYTFSEDLIMELWDNGNTLKEISVKLSIPTDAMRKYINKNMPNIKLRKRLNVSLDYVEVQKMRAGGMSFLKIANALKCSKTTIIRYCKEKGIK